MPKALEIINEGCLSTPNKRALVTRYTSISTYFYNRAGERMRIDLEGLPARIYQHELDHLYGLLFTDLVHPSEIFSEKEFEEKIKQGIFK